MTESLDILEQIEFDQSLSRTEKIDRIRDAITHEDPGSELRMHLLLAASDHLMDEGRNDEARQTIDQVAQESDEGRRRATLQLLHLECLLDNRETVDELLSQLLALSKAGLLSNVDHGMVAADLEEYGREREAVRWLTIPIRDVHPDDLQEQHFHCVNARYRIRRDLDLPLDAYDRASEEIQQHLRSQWIDDHH